MLKQSMVIGGRYEIMEQIGTGGMSDVYKALDCKLNRFVAIKVLKQEYSENESFVTKFRIEAQAAAGLSHPNIVNVYDVGEEMGIHYFVMELVEGITLKKYIEKKARLSVKEAISIGIQVSMGLDAAHKKHIIHRDVKPQNIIISRDGKVKVTDFGIAKAATSNTITSNAMGSVHYTSPEQARGGYSDEKSDIYSLGITMYEMITGRVPFDGETTVAVALKHIQEEFPSAREYLQEIPVSLEQIIFKCTQKNPDLRYASMSELIDDLKKSLISPDGDFVKIIPIPGSEGTKMISDEDVKLIKRQTGKLDYLNFKNKTPSFIADEDMDEDEEEFNEEYDEEFDDEEEDDNDEINPRMEKILSILGIVTVIIIAFIVIFIVGKTFGFFKGSPNKDKANTEETTDTDTDTDKEDTTDVTMVNVVGLTIVEATKQLNALGLGVKTSYDFNDDYDRDYVIQQDIAEGDSVPVNTTINLVLSQGIESIDIPTVTGETEESAKKILEDLEFKVIRDYEPSDTVEAGKVISTTPASGTGAEKGATITLLISTGKDIKLATVPDIRNLSQAGAQNALSAVGLTWNTIDQAYHETVQEGLVISQSYSPGSQVEQGTAVDFVISLGRKVEVTYSYDGPVDVDGLKGTANVQLISDGSSKVLYSNNMSIPNNISVSNIKEADLNGTPNATIKITYTVVIPASTNPVDGTTIPESQNTGETYYSVVLKRSNQ